MGGVHANTAAGRRCAVALVRSIAAPFPLPARAWLAHCSRQPVGRSRRITEPLPPPRPPTSSAAPGPSHTISPSPQHTFDSYVKKYNAKKLNNRHNRTRTIDYAKDCLRPVDGGDTIFICAHGHEKQNFISKRPNQKSSDGTLSISDSAKLLQESSSVGPSPIWIKPLVCWAGGPTLTLKQLDDFFERYEKSHKNDRYSPKWRHHTLRNHIQKLPGYTNKDEVVFAKGLAIKLQKQE